jgi:hypothetical protein
MREWHLSADQSHWEYRDGERVVDTLRWDRDGRTYGCYVNRDGHELSRDFGEAKRIIETGAKPAGAAQVPLFGGKR